MTADPSFDPETLPEPTPHDRLRGVAAIFAAGLIRLHERAALPTEPAAEKSQHLVQKGLEERV
jgi:hypothetical protein